MTKSNKSVEIKKYIYKLFLVYTKLSLISHKNKYHLKQSGLKDFYPK